MLQINPQHQTPVQHLILLPVPTKEILSSLMSLDYFFPSPQMQLREFDFSLILLCVDAAASSPTTNNLNHRLSLTIPQVPEVPYSSQSLLEHNTSKSVLQLCRKSSLCTTVLNTHKLVLGNSAQLPAALPSASSLFREVQNKICYYFHQNLNFCL